MAGACSSGDEPFADPITDCGGRGDGAQRYARLLSVAEEIEQGASSAIEYVNNEQEERTLAEW